MESEFSPRYVWAFKRLRANANLKRQWLLKLGYRQTKHRKRLNIAAGVLALLSAATVTSVLADFTTAAAMKVIAALLSTVSGIISLYVNTGFKDSEISDFYNGAARYLALRERAARVLLNPDIDVQRMDKALEELQIMYSELDLQYQRYLVGVREIGTDFKDEEDEVLESRFIDR